MIYIFSCNYLSRQPIETAMREFGRQFDSDATVVDIGCGNKPYQKYFKAKYVGVDPFPDTNPDIKSNAWDIPLPDNCADAIILNQALEHIQKTEATIKEVFRLLKPGGLVIVTVPMTMRLHGIPVSLKDASVQNIPLHISSIWKEDYYRFTKFGLLYLFEDFKPITLYETRTTFSTLIQQVNYFIASFGLGHLPAPLYLVNNILALGIDSVCSAVRRLPIGMVKRFDELVTRGLTADYVFICQKEKQKKTR